MFKIQGLSVFINCESVRKKDRMKYRQRKESKSSGAQMEESAFKREQGWREGCAVQQSQTGMRGQEADQKAPVLS